MIYGGRTTQRLPRYQFPKGFSLTVDEKHFPNTNESAKLLNEITVPYFKKASIKSFWSGKESSRDNGRIYQASDFRSQINFRGKQHISNQCPC